MAAEVKGLPLPSEGAMHVYLLDGSIALAWPLKTVAVTTTYRDGPSGEGPIKIATEYEMVSVLKRLRDRLWWPMSSLGWRVYWTVREWRARRHSSAI